MIDKKIESELNRYTTIIKVVEKRLLATDPMNVSNIYVWAQIYTSLKAAKGAITSKQNYRKRYYNSDYLYSYYLCMLVAINNKLTWEMIEVICK